ncbi:unnamed protein product [Xylocopa violacea]|uniref:Uncharacterized protein n=1 Tax=Xylocopa violacea TaxID=135666 RepID=A0ABP1NIB2_XYLVO
MYVRMYVRTYVCMHVCIYMCEDTIITIKHPFPRNLSINDYVSIRLYAYSRIYSMIYTYICAYLYICIYRHSLLYIFVKLPSVYIRTYICIPTSIYVYTYVCMYICLYACICICMYICKNESKICIHKNELHGYTYTQNTSSSLPPLSLTLSLSLSLSLFLPVRPSLISVTNMTETRTRNDTHTRYVRVHVYGNTVTNGIDSQKTTCTRDTQASPLFLSNAYAGERACLRAKRTRAHTQTTHSQRETQKMYRCSRVHARTHTRILITST